MGYACNRFDCPVCFYRIRIATIEIIIAITQIRSTTHQTTSYAMGWFSFSQCQNKSFTPFPAPVGGRGRNPAAAAVYRILDSPIFPGKHSLRYTIMLIGKFAICFVILPIFLIHRFPKRSDCANSAFSVPASSF